MPPKAVRTLMDLIFWQYAKIISESAGFGKSNYGFIKDPLVGPILSWL